MAGFHESKHANICVANLANSLAIGGDLRLGLGEFESHANSSRINQYFPREFMINSGQEKALPGVCLQSTIGQ